jgi:multidrug efflux pump subunit AcrB
VEVKKVVGRVARCPTNFSVSMQIGIVKKNGIMMIVFALDKQRGEGHPAAKPQSVGQVG